MSASSAQPAPRDAQRTPRAERRGRLPDRLRQNLSPPKAMEDGSKVYEAVLMQRAVLQFGDAKVLRGDRALAELARSGRLDGLRVQRGPEHPRLTAKGFEKISAETIGTVVRSYYDPEWGVLVGRVRVWSQSDQATVEALLDGVSMGYFSVDGPGGVHPEAGAYDTEVLIIFPDHIVTTDRPRGGDAAALRIETAPETIQAPQTKPEGSMDKIKVGDREYGAEEIQALLDERASIKAEAATLRTRAETAEGRAQALQAQVDKSAQGAQVKAHLKLATEAAGVLGVKAEALVEQEEGAIWRQVLVKVYGEAFGADKMEGAALQGAYMAAMAHLGSQDPSSPADSKRREALKNQPRIENASQPVRPKSWLART